MIRDIKDGAEEHMGSDRIGNDGLVDAVGDLGGVLFMESAVQDLHRGSLTAMEST